MILMDGMSASHVLWIAFLRASADYWWICMEQGDCLDPRLVQVWKDFAIGGLSEGKLALNRGNPRCPISRMCHCPTVYG
jgi:hypothetical protein